MKLKQYQVVLQTVGPVFVGSGKELKKKEYVFLGKGQVGIPDLQRMYQYLQKAGKEQDFETYLLYNNREDLATWLRNQKISGKEIQSFLQYSLDCGDAVLEKGAKIQMLSCVKDPYGNPYIPGTSLKGMFRTLFLCEDILEHTSKYASIKQHIQNLALQRSMNGKGDRKFLRKESAELEAMAYRILNRENTKSADAVNDIMQGFIVSDSESLSTDDLVLCQPVEVHVDGTEKRLPILRECVKPGVSIRFTVTVDSTLCNYSKERIENAVRMFINNYTNKYMRSFAKTSKPAENSVILGGGSGFVSKTVLYALYEKKDAVNVTKNVFDKTGVPKIHKHDKDTLYGVSPHILKCTKYRGETIQMGVCEITLQELK